ncbi:MAG TPA: Hsp70 family protein, partial [Gemmatimonadota bacterium]
PTKKTEVFSTAEDNQTTVEIHVLQGEREMATGNKTIGRFQLTGIPPAPRGIPQIEVTFDIDANGILHVSAKDKATGKEQKIRIEASSGLSESEIEQMVKDAESHAAEDKERRQRVELRNKADSLVYSTEKNVKDLEEKMTADQKAKIEAALERTREALKKDDDAEVRAASDDLQQLWHQVAQQAYQAASAGADAGGPAGEAGPEPEAPQDEGVIEADYEVVDEEK